MKQKVLTKLFVMISNWRKPSDFHRFYKNISALWGLKGWTLNSVITGSRLNIQLIWWSSSMSADANCTRQRPLSGVLYVRLLPADIRRHGSTTPDKRDRRNNTPRMNISWRCNSACVISDRRMDMSDWWRHGAPVTSESRIVTSQHTQNMCITIVQCWTNVEDVGPTLYKCYTHVLCLLGWPASLCSLLGFGPIFNLYCVHFRWTWVTWPAVGSDVELEQHRLRHAVMRYVKWKDKSPHSDIEN